MKIAVVQMHIEKEKYKNLETAEIFIKQAVENKAKLVILPEMFNCPYETKNFPLYAEEDGGTFWRQLSDIAKRYHIYFIAGSVPECTKEHKIYNTSYVFDPKGTQIAKHRKMHLFDIDVTDGQSFRESDTLTAGNAVTVFDTPFGKMGLCICYDIRFPELCRIMALEGAKAIFVPAAFNMTTGPAHWEILFRTRALDNQVYMIGAAPARQEDSNYISYGNSIAVDPWGNILHRFDKEEGIFFCDLDFEKVEQIRKELPLLKHRRTDIYTLYTLVKQEERRDSGEFSENKRNL